jgi:DNA-directed RNA polymerase alpha subunit
MGSMMIDKENKLTRRTKVEDVFSTRLSNLCKASGFNELGDFENNTLAIIPSLGSKSINDIAEILREANILCIEEKILLLYKKKDMIINYQTVKNTPFGNILKQSINQIQV